ncbi:DNA binding protein [Actinidia rufa]|uniref:DNA binding protein n=1 Tax=Actinidia rufa TaxID=165716 RepID=A0A7J0ERC9_9ERIC|nr:DNA binding protein [Actinidia rufa]
MSSSHTTRICANILMNKICALKSIHTSPDCTEGMDLESLFLLFSVKSTVHSSPGLFSHAPTTVGTTDGNSPSMVSSVQVSRQETIVDKEEAGDGFSVNNSKVADGLNLKPQMSMGHNDRPERIIQFWGCHIVLERSDLQFTPDGQSLVY